MHIIPHRAKFRVVGPGSCLALVGHTLDSLESLRSVFKLAIHSHPILLLVELHLRIVVRSYLQLPRVGQVSFFLLEEVWVFQHLINRQSRFVHVF